MEPTVLSQLLPAAVLAAILVWILFNQRKPDSQLSTARARVAHAAPPPRARATQRACPCSRPKRCAARKPSSSASACRTRSRAYCSSCSARSWSRLRRVVAHAVAPLHATRVSARRSQRSTSARVRRGTHGSRSTTAPRPRSGSCSTSSTRVCRASTTRTRSRKRSASVGSTASSGASTPTATRVSSRRANRTALGRRSIGAATRRSRNAVYFRKQGAPTRRD